MGRVLAAHVYVDGVLHTAGSVPPKDVAERITNPKAWGSDVDSPDVPGEVPSDTWKVAELKTYADAHGVDVGDAKSKADLLAALNG